MINATILLTLLFCLTSHAISDRPEAKANRELPIYSKILREITDFLGIESLGYQAVSAENEEYIRAIQHELKMDDYCIEIRHMSNLAQRLIGRANAFVFPSILLSNKSHAYMYISEEWFNTLTTDEKQALIRHELMHLKKDHCRKKFILTYLITLVRNMTTLSIAQGAYTKYINPINADQRKQIIISAVARIIGLDLISQAITAAYSRSVEKEADMKALKTMENKEGFINLFNELKNQYLDPSSKFKIKRILAKAIKPINHLFDSHPELDDRIDYIQNLA